MLYEELTKSLKRMARLDCEADGMFSPEEHTAWEAAETIEKLEKQRDELLKALEKVLPAVVECERAYRKIGAVVAHEEIARALAESRELIASVQGGE